MTKEYELAALSDYLKRHNRARAERLSAPIDQPWRVSYRFPVDRPGMETVHRAESPRALVQFLRDHFPPTMQFEVVRVWEAL
jgi:hypothetical protein